MQRAVSEIQDAIYKRGDATVRRMQEIAEQYQALHKHCERRYDEWRALFKDDERLVKAIVYWYTMKRLQQTLFEPPD